MTPVQRLTPCTAYLLRNAIPMAWQAMATEPPMLDAIAPIAGKSAALPTMTGGKNSVLPVRRWGATSCDLNRQAATQPLRP